jgi:hypothetical protein
MIATLCRIQRLNGSNAARKTGSEKTAISFEPFRRPLRLMEEHQQT